MEIRTDLAHEIRERAVKMAKYGGKDVPGVIFSDRENNGIRSSRIEITDESGEKELGLGRGVYVTVFFGDMLSLGTKEFNAVCDETARELRGLLPEGRRGPVLVCGVGNSGITPDSVGPLSVSSVAVTHALKKNRPRLYEKLGLGDVSCIAPGVTAQTGIDAAEIVRGAADACSAETVIAVDALCAADVSRLGRTVQLSSVGLSPGSGIGGGSEELSLKTVGRRVIGIGVPTIADVATVAGHGGKSWIPEETRELLRGLFICPQDIDRLALRLATMCAYSINKAINPDMTYEEMAELL